MSDPPLEKELAPAGESASPGALAPVPLQAAMPTGDGPAEAAEADEAQGGNALDRLVNAALGHLTQGISPASVVGAYADWYAHLASAPGKQRELMQKAWRKAARLILYAAQLPTNGVEPGILPLAQDQRFRSPGWRRWPYNVIYQSFLFGQQWLHNATTGVRGVSRHHEQLVTFLTRQWMDIFSPSNFFWTNPEVLQATVAQRGANLARGAQYWWQDLFRLAGGLPPQQPAGHAFRPGIEVAVTPGKVVYRNHLIELIQYEAQTGQARAVPALIVPSWILKYYILDLSPGNSLVAYLVRNGYTVFMISWRNPGSEDRDLGMDDYLKQGVLAAMDAVQRIRPGQPINAVGYCLGGTLMAMAAAWLARERDARLHSLTLFASEVDFTEPGELGLFIDQSQLAYLEDVMWEQGYLDGKQMAGAFALLNSRDLVWSRIVRDYLMGERTELNDLNAWNADATRLPYRQHREYLERLYLNNELAEGRYQVDGRPIALSDIRVPLFAVGTERDTVSPWRSVYKIHLFTDVPTTFCLTSGGHNVGVVNPPEAKVARSYRAGLHEPGRPYQDPDAWIQTHEAREGSWWPCWEQWLRERSGEVIPAPACGSPAAGLPPLDDAPGRYVRVS